MTGEWTLAELVGRAARALAAADVRSPNGRVTEMPDARMIRWYATIGLVDKPSGFRGRTALYGPRHLMQLVAVKRLQAQGRALAQIQALLTGATEATLRRIADLPAAGETRTADLPAAGQTRIADLPAAGAGAGEAIDGTRAGGTRAAGSESTVDGFGEVAAPRPRFWAARPASPDAEAPVQFAAERSHGPHGTMHGVGLAGGAMLLVPATLDPDQLAAVRHAARPLLEYLSAHGLLNPDEGAHA